MVPAEPWVVLRPTEARRWLYDPDRDNGADGLVKLIRFPDEAMGSFHDAGFSAIRTLQDVEVIRRRPATRIAINRLVRFVAMTLVETANNLLSLGLSAYDCGMKTVSYDHHRGCRVGLHVDDWDDLPIPERRHARSVLLLNLGRSKRYFLFVDIPIDKMPVDGAIHFPRPRRVVTEFLGTHPGHPVVRVTVPPGWAYIAPTGRLIHDGSNEDASGIDVHLAIVGHFI